MRDECIFPDISSVPLEPPRPPIVGSTAWDALTVATRVAGHCADMLVGGAIKAELETEEANPIFSNVDQTLRRLAV